MKFEIIWARKSAGRIPPGEKHDCTLPRGFDRLFEESWGAMQSMKWVTEKALTKAQAKKIVSTEFGNPNAEVGHIFNDDGVLMGMFTFLLMIFEEKQYVYVSNVLYGNDYNGSKKWAFTPEMVVANLQFVPVVQAAGMVAAVHKGDGVHRLREAQIELLKNSPLVDIKRREFKLDEVFGKEPGDTVENGAVAIVTDVKIKEARGE